MLIILFNKDKYSESRIMEKQSYAGISINKSKDLGIIISVYKPDGTAAVFCDLSADKFYFLTRCKYSAEENDMTLIHHPALTPGDENKTIINRMKENPQSFAAKDKV